MGYLSDVSIVLKKKDYEQLAQHFCQVMPEDYPTPQDFLSYWSSVVFDNDYVHLTLDQIKWDDSYPDVKEILDFLDTVEHEYLCMGEDRFDVVEENTFKNGECFLDHGVKLLFPKDIERLDSMLDDIEGNIGRCIVHGTRNGDTTEDIVSNIVSDIRMCLVRRWAAQMFPGRYTGMNPEDSRFPDDDLFESEYEEEGYPLE